MNVENPLKKAVEIVGSAEQEINTIHTGEPPPQEFINMCRNVGSKRKIKFRRLIVGSLETAKKLYRWIAEDLRQLGKRYEIRIIQPELCKHRGMILVDNRKVLYRGAHKAFYYNDPKSVAEMRKVFYKLWEKARPLQVSYA